MFLNNSAATNPNNPFVTWCVISYFPKNDDDDDVDDDDNDKSSDNKCSLVLPFTIYQASCQQLIWSLHHNLRKKMYIYCSHFSDETPRAS